MCGVSASHCDHVSGFSGSLPWGEAARARTPERSMYASPWPSMPEADWLVSRTRGWSRSTETASSPSSAGRRSMKPNASRACRHSQSRVPVSPVNSSEFAIRPGRNNSS